MSTLQVANIHLESTGNNRIQYDGSNTFTIAAGDANVAVVNSSTININTDTSVGGTLSVNTNATIGGANVVTVSDTQTLTNKTINAPVINGPVTGNVVLSQATWETGTDTTEALVSPSKVAAAVESLAPAAWEKIGSTVTANNDAYVDFTIDTANYQSFKILFKGVKPSIDAASLEAFLSPDAGTTIRNTLSDYISVTVIGTYSETTGGTSALTADSEIVVSRFQGNAAGDRPLYAVLYLLYAGDSQIYTYFTSDGTGARGSGASTSSTYKTTGYCIRFETHNLIRFSYTSGNLASGDIELWGSKV